MNKDTYFQLVAAWEKRYGVPNRAFRYDPSDVKACCEKCGRMASKMSRHHKANDFFFALWFPDLYAATYIQFRKEDCAKLCNRCHKACERFYDSVKQELYEDFNARGGLKWSVNASFEEGHAWAEIWRAKFLAMYDKWQSRPIRRRKRKKRLPTKREK